MAALGEVAGPIWLITGVPGSGKSTIARAICARYPRAVHIPVDDLREFVVSGFASPLDAWTSEATRQFALARRTAARMAAEYSDTGFTVVIDDVIWRESAEEHFPDLRGRPLRKVALLPALEVALARNRTRVDKSFATSLLEPAIRELHRRFALSCRPEDGWTVLDTSELTVEESCSELLRIAPNSSVTRSGARNGPRRPHLPPAPERVAAMEDPREVLAHVLWIGGGPQSGKTTLSRLLAGKWDLKVYKADWRGANEHRARPGPAEREFLRLNMDERWALPSVTELVDRSIAIYGERFAKILDDLRQLPRSRVIVAEGPGVLPWNVAPVVKSPRQAIFLVPDGDWRDGVELRRFGAGQAKRFPGIVERERALAKVDERDALIDGRIRRSCTELGLRCVLVDGSLDIDDSLALLEEHFRPHLPDVPNV